MFFKTWIRRILLGVLGLALLVGAATAWVVTHFDGQRWASVASEWILQERQRTLTIDGPVRLELWPRLQIVASKLRLSERFKPEQRFVLVDEATFGVDLVPLLAQQAVVRQVELRGLKFEVQRGGDGLGNTDDLRSLPSSGALKFDVERTVIEDARVSIRDARWPLEGEIRFDRLTLGRLGEGRSTPVQLRAALALREPALAGQLEGKFSLTPAQGDTPLRVGSVALHFRGAAGLLRDLDARVAGEAQIDAPHDRFETQNLRVAFGSQGQGWRIDDAVLQVQHFGYQAVGGALAWTGLGLDAKGHLGDAARPFSLQLSSAQLGITEQQQSAGKGLKARFELQGDMPMQLNFESAAPSGKPGQWRLPGLRAEWKASVGSRRLEGHANGEALLRSEAPGGTLQRLSLERLELKGVYEPGNGGQPWPLGARGSMSLAPGQVQWNLNTTLAEDACAAEGSAQRPAPSTRDKPRVDLRLRCERLDLSRWHAGPTPVVAGGKPAASAKLAEPATPPAPASSASAVRLDLAALREVDAQFSLRATQLRLRPLLARDARIEGSLGGGVLAFDNVQAKLWEGSVEASGHVDAADAVREPRFDLRLQGDGVDVGAMLDDVGNLQGLQGRGKVRADLSSSGPDVQALWRGLVGQAELQLRDGAVVGLDLDENLRQPPASLTDAADELERAQPAQRTPFQNLKASFRIAEGVARTETLDLRSSTWQVAGNGQVDLARQRLEIDARAQVATPPAPPRNRPAPADPLAAVRGATLPLQLSGPFDAVDWRLRWSALQPGATNVSAGSPPSPPQEQHP